MMMFIVGIVGSLFIGCLLGVVIIEKPWVRVAMLLLFGLIAAMLLSAYHHAEMGKQRVTLMHQYGILNGMTNQMMKGANHTSEGIRQPADGSPKTSM